MTIEKDSLVADPGEPFTFVHLKEMDEADIDEVSPGYVQKLL